ncbi:MAG: hypothetical protein NVS4B3_10200 [Gemmatimonadaceae bacterium]
MQVVVHGRVRVTGEELYREVAHLTEAGPATELFVAGCGEGVTPTWLATRTGASVTGVDPDAERIAIAERRAREGGQGASLTYVHAELHNLPHETAVFDVAVGEPAIAAAENPERAVAELVRVTKPMGSVVLLQPTWSSEASRATRTLLVERLGLHPQLLVEWKRMMRDHGVVDIHVQDWTTGCGTARRSGTLPLVNGSPELTWQQKVQILGRAWRRWGERAEREAMERESTLIRELSRRRSLGFQLIKGVKWPYTT